MKTPPRRAIGMAVILLATLAAYSPAIRGEFIWDDDAHVTRSELRSVGGLWRIWTDWGATQQYYPLLHSAFWLQHKLWGDWVVGYHLVNILLHATAACLLWIILTRLAIPGGFLAACIFALHPVHVESVAWITELKNTLSLVFYLGAVLAYLRFDEKRDSRDYTIALTLFVLGLLSKTVVATLPAALLLIIWWKRGRISWENDVRPLTRFFVLGIFAGFFTAWLERTLIGAQGADFDLTLAQRFQLCGRVVWFYLAKLFWPAKLTFIYPRWDMDRAPPWHWLFLGGLIALIAVLWLIRKRTRGPLAAVLFFVGSLVPVLGFFNVFPFKYSFVADHFQYLPSIGIIVLISAAITVAGKSLGKVIPVVLVIVLGMLTWRQAHMYRDKPTLYLTTLDRNPACWMAHTNLGVYYESRQDFGEAMNRYQQALAIKSDSPEALSNVGSLLAKQGRVNDAIAYLEKAVNAQPRSAGMRFNLATALAGANRMDEAIASYEKGLALEPENLDALMNLTAAYAAVNRRADAIATAQRALETARRQGNDALASQIAQSLAAYRQSQ